MQRFLFRLLRNIVILLNKDTKKHVADLTKLASDKSHKKYKHIIICVGFQKF